jgi:leucyl aminopeptidase
MTDAIAFAEPDAPATPLHAVPKDGLEDWLAGQPEEVARWLRRLGFSGAPGEVHLIPDGEGEIAVAGYGTAETRARGRFHLAAAAAALPPGAYRLVTDLPAAERDETALGWLLSAYRFARYKANGRAPARLVCPDGADADRLLAIARGEALTRDLINTPAADMGPAELAEAARGLAAAFGASCEVIEGPALAEGFPLIHTVGRASPRAPRLIDLRHGESGPRLTLVGKGVCFDTGGLDIKPAASMGLMKKDMGGAATVLGLARMILALGWPVRLRVLIPAVENAVSGEAFRPQDVLTARNGKTVEVNNTDAEGRLVLADALALAMEEGAEVLVSMATLTGAARVAVGPDIAPFFTGDERLAALLAEAGAAAADPVWRLPFHEPYEGLIEPAIADLDNAPKNGFAGAITAALFLRRFAAGADSYTHFDIYGWQPAAAPARPVGGVGQGARALLAALPARLGL